MHKAVGQAELWYVEDPLCQLSDRGDPVEKRAAAVDRGTAREPGKRMAAVLERTRDFPG